ncbi:MAG: hypothetical protein M1358_12635 [Chloroflexi bacterium]|nr:hypothetical protein [Chloroflexota bacterium]
MADDFMKYQREDYQRLVEKLREEVDYVHVLPPLEARVARLAVDGRQPYEIAQELRLSDEAVWEILHRFHKALFGIAPQGQAQGGLGSDTEPGVTGGYGDTGFGGIDVGPEREELGFEGELPEEGEGTTGTS